MLGYKAPRLEGMKSTGPLRCLLVKLNCNCILLPGFCTIASRSMNNYIPLPGCCAITSCSKKKYSPLPGCWAITSRSKNNRSPPKYNPHTILVPKCDFYHLSKWLPSTILAINIRTALKLNSNRSEMIFSRVLRNPFLGLTAPAQIIWWPQ